MATITPQNREQTAKVKAKKTTTVKDAGTLFTKENHKWMLIGGGIIALGYFLMSGGKAINPNEFDPKEVYSTMRITVAPLLVLAGLGVLVYAILKKGAK
jgi:Protein of unknown function (DUF3098)